MLVESQRPAGKERGHMVMVHGLEGSSQAGYMRSLAAAALEAGFAAHRFNLRTCGGTARSCNTLYHAGLTSDLFAVLRQLRAEGGAPAILVGFSLGGNVVLKLAGELGDAAPELIERGGGRFGSSRSGGLRAPPGRTRQSTLRTPLRGAHASPPARHRPLCTGGDPQPALGDCDRRPDHRSVVRLRQRGQLLPHPIRADLSAAVADA